MTTFFLQQKLHNDKKKKIITFFSISDAGPKATPKVVKTPLKKFLAKVSPSLALTPSKFLPSIKTDKSRIGILRRPEGESSNFENDLIVEKMPSIGSANIEHHHFVSNIDLNVSPKKSVHNTSFRNKSAQCEFELKVPETVPLKSSLLRNGTQHELAEKNGRNDEQYAGQYVDDGNTKPREIPYWLRPTPVQPYPYNFIVAVRKKLESITNPVFGPCKPYQWPDPHEASFHSPVAPPDMVFSSNYRRNFDRTQSESEKSMSENIKSNDNANEEQDEYEMDFSSVTFESKQNHSNSRSKSKRKSLNGSQDTLSISSGILSHSSPEKKVQTTTSDGNNEKDNEERQPSPLTTDNVDGLHITSRSLSQNERISDANSVVSRQSIISSVASHINFGRGKDYSSHSIPSLRKLSQQHSIAQLLDDFKTSLSAAIETNQRLHEMLSNPPSSRLTQYSDDFEHESENNHSRISEPITETHETMTVPSYKSSYPSASQTNSREHEERIDSVEKIDSNNGTSTTTKIVEDVVVVSSNQENISSNQTEENTQEGSSRTQKQSSTLIEEKIDDYQSSESPTNNDLKSVSLSIAKKSVPTSDDTDQPSNAIESFNKQITGQPEVPNESVGTDVFNVFNKTELNLDGDLNKSIWSEHNISYSTLGMVSFFITFSGIFL